MEFEKFFNFYANYFRYLNNFIACILFFSVIEYQHNYLISKRKGEIQNVYFKECSSTSSKSVFIYQSRQGTGILVLLYHFGIHHPFYLFHIFKHFSLHQYPFRPQCQQTSILCFYGIQQNPME